LTEYQQIYSPSERESLPSSAFYVSAVAMCALRFER